MHKDSNRPRRVGGLIQRELAELIRREAALPGLGMITVSAVDVAPDLKLAKVYYTLLGGTLSIEDTTAHLARQAGTLRYHLAQRLNTRTTPRLQFIHDASVEYGSRLSSLIDSLVTPEDPASGQDSENR